MGPSSLLSSSESEVKWGGRSSISWDPPTPRAQASMAGSRNSLASASSHGRGSNSPPSLNGYFPGGLPRTSAASHSFLSQPDTFPSSVGSSESSAMSSFRNLTSDTHSASLRPNTSGRVQSNTGPSFANQDSTLGEGSLSSIGLSSLSGGGHDQSSSVEHSPYSPVSGKPASIFPPLAPRTARPSFVSDLPTSPSDITTTLGNLQLDATYPLPVSTTVQNQNDLYPTANAYDNSMSRMMYGPGFDDGLAPYQPSDIFNDITSSRPFNMHRLSEKGTVSPSFQEYGALRNIRSGGGTPLSGRQFPPRTGRRLSSQVSDGPIEVLESRLRGLQHQQHQQSYLHPMGAPFAPRLPIQPSYPFNYPPNASRMDRFSNYMYPTTPLPAVPPSVHISTRAYGREHDPNRSPLLEEFRSNSKGNKRYELKVSIQYYPFLLVLIFKLRIFTAMSLNSVATSTGHDSFSRS